MHHSESSKNNSTKEKPLEFDQNSNCCYATIESEQINGVKETHVEKTCHKEDGVNPSTFEAIKHIILDQIWATKTRKSIQRTQKDECLNIL